MVLLSTIRARSIVSDGSRMCACSSNVSKHADDGSWLPGAAGAMGVVDPLVEMSRTTMHAAYSLGHTAYRSNVSYLLDAWLADLTLFLLVVGEIETGSPFSADKIGSDSRRHGDR